MPLGKKMPTTLFEFLGKDVEGGLSLAMGAPGPKTLRRCAAIMQQASQIRLSDATEGDASFMQYGCPAGDPRFRTALAGFLADGYQDTVDLDDLVSTAGATSGLQHLLHMLFPKKCTVFCDEITYHCGINLLKEMHCTLSPVSFNEGGINVEELERKFEANSGDFDSAMPPPVGVRDLRGALYLVPTFHNPTGRVLLPERARRIVELARKHHILVICDDVYNLLYYEGHAPPKRLFAYDDKSEPDYQGNVVSNGTFSKLLSPGLRLGWMELPPWLRVVWDQSSVLDSGGCLNMYTAAIVACALESNILSDFVGEMRRIYKSRVEIVAQILNEKVSDLCSFEMPKGGYFFWLKLPDHVELAEVSRLAEEYKIQFTPGPKFCPNEEVEEKYRQFIRLSISYLEEEPLSFSVAKLCDFIRQLASTTNSS